MLQIREVYGFYEVNDSVSWGQHWYFYGKEKMLYDSRRGYHGFSFDFLNVFVNQSSCVTAISKTSTLPCPLVSLPIKSDRGLKAPGSTKPTTSHSEPTTS